MAAAVATGGERLANYTAVAQELVARSRGKPRVIQWAIIVAAIVCPAGYRWLITSGPPCRGPAPRSSPIAVVPHVPHCITIPEDVLRAIQEQVQPLGQGMTTSLYLHSLRVFGLDFSYSRGELMSSSDTLRLFSDPEFSRRILGTPLMVPTPNGFRCTPDADGRARESHRDYCLAVLSELAVPHTWTANPKSAPFRLKDLLEDSIANFHLGQREIEWTAMAYAQWLPPARTWVNKFNETWSFDDLAAELMRRPLNDAACAGSHLVQAMILIHRIDDEKASILSPSIHARLRWRDRVHGRARRRPAIGKSAVGRQGHACA